MGDAFIFGRRCSPVRFQRLDQSFQEIWKDDERLARAGGQCEQDAAIAGEDGADRAVDGDFLIVTRAFAAVVVIGGEELRGDFGRKRLPARQALPEFLRRGEGVDFAFDARQVIELDDALAGGRVGELQVEDFGVFLRLLHSFAGRGVVWLGLDDGNGKIGTVAEDVIGPLARTAATAPPDNDNPAVGERDLFVDAIRLVVPACGLQLGHDIATACIGFVGHCLDVRLGAGPKSEKERHTTEGQDSRLDSARLAAQVVSSTVAGKRVRRLGARPYSEGNTPSPLAPLPKGEGNLRAGAAVAAQSSLPPTQRRRGNPAAMPAGDSPRPAPSLPRRKPITMGNDLEPSAACPTFGPTNGRLCVYSPPGAPTPLLPNRRPQVKEASPEYQ